MIRSKLYAPVSAGLSLGSSELEPHLEEIDGKLSRFEVFTMVVFFLKSCSLKMIALKKKKII